MVEVSENFRELAQKNGRHVYCRIEAGSVTSVPEVFLDDRIIEFDFDDVAHPDWFTLGTTCANRFYFVVKYNGELNVMDRVLPYISFDNKEWCPLGIFYVSRRYVRDGYASIVCYDRMYSLDTDYESSLPLPTDTVKIMEEICSQTGLVCEDKGITFAVENIPECSVRDMIGYIASVNRACAKLDKLGRLVFREYVDGEFVIDEKNCMSIRRNMGRSVVTCLKAETEDELLISGDGAEISTLELYNPIMTQERLDSLYALFKPYSFYGAEIEMQGMPFIESGEHVQLLENGLLYDLIVSEIEYHYDGGLTARLYSKNKSYTDAAPRTDDLEKLLTELRKSVGTMYSKHINDKMLAIKSDPVIAADFEFNTLAKTFVQVDVNFTVDTSTADFLIVSVYVNGVKAERDAVQYMPNTGRELVHYYYLAENIPAGKNRIYVTLSTKTGDCYILEGQLIATVLGYGIAGGGSGDVRDRLSFIDKMTPVSASAMEMKVADITDENAECTIDS